MLTGRRLFVALVTSCCLFIPSHFIQFVYASVCHDGAWDAGEYCGYDAVATTTNHVPDMNHDCVVNGLDLQLFFHEFAGAGSTGPNLSGDFKSAGGAGNPTPCPGDQLCPDGRVSNADFSFFVTKLGQTASPCTSVPIPSVCDGSLALSFSNNPSTITNTATQAPNTLQNLYVVINGVANAEMAEFIVKASSNVQIVSSDAAGLCSGFDPDYVAYIPTPVASGPAIVATLQYFLTNSNPASISIVSTSNCPYALSRWTDSTASTSHKFATMKGVGINGPVSAAITGCTPGTISGQVYSDKNFNCTYDSGIDDPLAGLVVQTTQGPYYAITDASGNYTLTVSSGITYTVKMAAALNDPWKKLSACQSPTTYSVPVAANGAYPNKNFSLLPLAKITGNVYRDFPTTTACTKDGIDLPVSSREMQANGGASGTYTTFTNANGDYSFNVPATSYLVSNYPIGGDPWALPGCQAASYSFTAAANTTTSGKDFALNLANPSAPCNIFLNFVSHGFNTLPYPCHIILSGPCPGAEHEYIVTLSEDILSGISLGTSAQLDINLDAKFTINSVSSPCTNSYTSPNAHEVVVSITGNISPGVQCDVHVLATPSSDGPYTNTVTLNGAASCTGTKTRTLTENSYCPCDPNDMLVQPRGCGPDGEVAMDQPLTYSIKFENVGTGRAHNIFIEDVLDEDLDLSSVSLVSSSHPVTGFQINGNKLVISLEGVDLAGTLGPETNLGEVVFTARPLPVEDQNDGYVENTASVFFDFNDPVVTNTVKNTFLDEPCATPVSHDPLPQSNYLGSNYPNPFNPTTTITYGMAAQGHVTIAIYNINGSLVRTLVSDDKPAGWYTANWDGRDQAGRPVASGVYFSQMRAGKFSGSKKLVLLK
jgi:uncharacterized repeat protein (TIGR01451 family)